MNAQQLGLAWYEKFSVHADDLYPGRYTLPFCVTLAEQAIAIRARAEENGSLIVAHNYLYPEFHELADLVGDSLGLSLEVQRRQPARVDFQSVFFMGATAKLINGDATRVFVQGDRMKLGCSLVFGTDHEWIERWKRVNPDGVVIAYVNSDVWTKAHADYISTSRNTHKIIAAAAEQFPGRRILVLPDKYLGGVMRALAADLGADPMLVDIYKQPHNGFNACCYVHEKMGESAVEEALDAYPEAELIIHPECGCASSCLLKLNAGIIPRQRAYFLSTSQMLDRARASEAKQFLVATEKGMIYALRKALPEKEFIPVSDEASCRFMKANSLEGLLHSLEHDRVEIVLCDDCCDPKDPYEDEHVAHIPRSTAQAARVGIDRMLEIQ